MLTSGLRASVQTGWAFDGYEAIGSNVQQRAGEQTSLAGVTSEDDGGSPGEMTSNAPTKRREGVIFWQNDNPWSAHGLSRVLSAACETVDRREHVSKLGSFRNRGVAMLKRQKVTFRSVDKLSHQRFALGDRADVLVLTRAVYEDGMKARCFFSVESSS